MSPDSGIQADPIDDINRGQTFQLSVRVQLIKIRNTQCKVCICKQLNSFCLGKSHGQDGHVLFFRALNQKAGELFPPILIPHLSLRYRLQMLTVR